VKRAVSEDGQDQEVPGSEGQGMVSIHADICHMTISQSTYNQRVVEGRKG